MKSNDTLKSIDEIRKMAEEYGVDKNPLFNTTLERYNTQITILARLKETIDESDVLVTKEYVKDRGNYYTHPAITEFNRTTDSANKTLSTLIKIIKNFANEGSEDDPLVKIINGDDADD